MNCIKCGTYNADTSKFCIKCGNSLISDQNINQLNNSHPTIQSFDNNVKSNMMNNEYMSNGQVQNFNNVSTNQSTPNINETQNNQIRQNSNNMNNSYQQPNMTSNMNNSYQQSNITNNTNFSYQQSNITNNQSYTNRTSNKVLFGEYFYIILAFILKPFTALKEESNKFSNFKNSAILTLIVSVIATILSLIKTMLNVVIVKSYYGNETKWVWENLKEINYFKTIGTSLLTYVAVAFAIAVVYYLASLVVKKQCNFSKLLCISTISIVPVIICTLILSPVLSKLNGTLGIIVSCIGAIYAILIAYEGMNSEIILDGNIKFYFNLICLSILVIGGSYLITKIILINAANNITGNLNNIFGSLGI